MLSSFYEYHVIEHRFRRRLICLFRGKFERSVFYEFFNKDPSLGAFVTVKGLRNKGKKRKEKSA